MVKQIFPRVSASLSSSSSASDTYTGTPHRMTSVFSSCASGVFELSFAPRSEGVKTNTSSGAYPPPRGDNKYSISSAISWLAT